MFVVCKLEKQRVIVATGMGIGGTGTRAHKSLTNVAISNNSSSTSAVKIHFPGL